MAGCVNRSATLLFRVFEATIPPVPTSSDDLATQAAAMIESLDKADEHVAKTNPYADDTSARTAEAILNQAKTARPSDQVLTGVSLEKRPLERATIRMAMEVVKRTFSNE